MSITEISTPLFQRAGENVYRINLETTASQVKMENGSDLETRFAALSRAVSGQTATYVVEDIPARDALADVHTGDQCWVKDASADEGVERGAAKYIWESDEAGWVRTAEAESMIMDVAWEDVAGRPASSPADLDEAVSQRHGHANKTDVLDGLDADENGNLTFNGEKLCPAAELADLAEDMAGRMESLEDDVADMMEAGKPGILARVDELEKVFTPPAEDEPGKKGLVPAPGAMAMPGAESHYLGADGEWHSVKFIPPADAELYVAIDGSDELDEGRGWSADKPFKTIQAALDYAAAHLILDRDFTINVAAGTYEENVLIPRIHSKGWEGNRVIIQGPTTGTATVHSSSGYTIRTYEGTSATIENLTVSCTEVANASSVMAERCNLIFENCTFVGRRALHCYGHAFVLMRDCTIDCGVSTAKVIMLQGVYNGLQMTGTIKVAGSCSTFMEIDSRSCVIAYQATFSGTMTGRRYTIYRGALIYTGGKGANFLPGSTAGTVETQSGAIYY